ncbi:thiopeptide-type bacteriocin biosynthesis protein [Sphaerimonospora mesophila]|uniref:thiopeptide-type bacteriocin biosynthesis protein n=1 Tax=Sphaerimonospora mesophila TaxID=37483 RepID=UPI0006E336D8
MMEWPQADWLYYRIYLDSYQRTQVILEEVVRPLSEDFTAQSGEGNWFFLRYLDPSGLHVRLRLLGTEDRISALESRIDAALDELFDTGALSTPVTGEARIRVQWGAQDRRGYVKTIYEPEYVKWGGESGLEFAHRCFEASSRFAIESVDEGSWTGRPLVALMTMAASLALLPHTARSGFAYQYVWYWCGGGRTDPKPVLDAIRGSADRTAARIVEGTRNLIDEPRRIEHLGRYLRVLSESIGDRATAASGRTSAHLLFHHLHLTNNRLGINPREEALLMEILQRHPDLVSAIADRTAV